MDLNVIRAILRVFRVILVANILANSSRESTD